MTQKPTNEQSSYEVAINLYQSGERLNFSTNIAGLLTYGYGRVDDLGFFEFELPYSHLSQEHKNLVDGINSDY